MRERTAEVNRLQKTLEGANIKLASVVSDVTGVSAARCWASWWPGSEDAAALADWRRGQLRRKRAELEQALTGRMSAHQRFMLAQHLALIDSLDEQIAAVGEEIAERLRPFEAELAILDSIPGIGRWSAEVILAEIGTDMSRFRPPGTGQLGGDVSRARRERGQTPLRARRAKAAPGCG